MNCPMFSIELSSGDLGDKGRSVMLRGILNLPVPVPAGLIDDENGMGAQAHLGRYFFEMPLLGLGVAAGQNEGGADTARGADSAEDIG